jgi:hypothetical protein
MTPVRLIPTKQMPKKAKIIIPEKIIQRVVLDLLEGDGCIGSVKIVVRRT